MEMKKRLNALLGEVATSKLVLGMSSRSTGLYARCSLSCFRHVPRDLCEILEKIRQAHRPEQQLFDHRPG